MMSTQSFIVVELSPVGAAIIPVKYVSALCPGFVDQPVIDGEMIFTVGSIDLIAIVARRTISDSLARVPEKKKPVPGVAPVPSLY